MNNGVYYSAYLGIYPNMYIWYWIREDFVDVGIVTWRIDQRVVFDKLWKLIGVRARFSGCSRLNWLNWNECEYFANTYILLADPNRMCKWRQSIGLQCKQRAYEQHFFLRTGTSSNYRICSIVSNIRFVLNPRTSYFVFDTHLLSNCICTGWHISYFDYYVRCGSTFWC